MYNSSVLVQFHLLVVYPGSYYQVVLSSTEYDVGLDHHKIESHVVTVCSQKTNPYFSAMSQGYDKEAARKRRGEKRRLKRRSNAIKAANA